MKRTAIINRKTKETNIECNLTFPGTGKCEINTEVPFFDHMLNAMFFHGGFDIVLKAKGDIEVDYHHLVEDCGIVIGQALFEIFEKNRKITRFGNFSIPMDDALCTTIVDFCNRPYLVYNATYPQVNTGLFEVALHREFFLALANNAKINLHIQQQYGDNSHHISEAIYKSCGKAIAMALHINSDNIEKSTKGSF